MNRRSPINPLWEAHIERIQSLGRAAGPAAPARHPRRAVVGAYEVSDVRSGEWNAAPPGRLGRRLLADIEPYLEFFAIARAA